MLHGFGVQLVSLSRGFKNPAGHIFFLLRGDFSCALLIPIRAELGGSDLRAGYLMPGMEYRRYWLKLFESPWPWASYAH